MFDSVIATTVVEWFPPDGPTVNPWPFPPATGAAPWTQKQIKEYAQQQRAKLLESPM